MNKKKLFIEASNLIDAHPTGIPVYTRNLISQLVNNSDLHDNFDFSVLISTSRWKKSHLCPTLPRVKKSWYIKRLVLKSDMNLIHYTGVFTNHFSKAPKIITIHDLAVLKPEHQFPYYTSRETIQKTRKSMDNIAKKIDAIIFVSESTRQDFLNLYSFPVEKTSVIYLGSNFRYGDENSPESSILTKYKLRSKKYYLFIGSISIRKNVLNLIKAFLMNERFSDFDLVLAGNQGMGSEGIFDEISKNDRHGRIKYTGFISDQEVIELYRNAGAFVFPTYYEGFGMPIIDAMNFGIPVMIGNRGSAPELSGSFATQVDPFNIDSISEGLKNVLNVNQNVLDKAKKHAQGFTWEKCAAETMSVYRSLLKDSFFQ